MNLSMSCYSWSVLGKQLCKSCTSGKKENIYTYYLEERGVIWNTYTDYTVILNIYADYLGGYLEYLCRLSGGGIIWNIYTDYLKEGCG